MCKNLDEYRWSSHYFYKRGFNSFVKTDFTLNLLSPKKAAAQMIYLELVNMYGDDSNPEADQRAVQLKYNFKDESFETINKDAPVPSQDLNL